MISLFACVVYVVSTYYDGQQQYQYIFSSFEIIFSTLFAVDYSWNFVQAKNKKKFIFLG